MTGRRRRMRGRDGPRRPPVRRVAAGSEAWRLRRPMRLAPGQVMHGPRLDEHPPHLLAHRAFDREAKAVPAGALAASSITCRPNRSMNVRPAADRAARRARLPPSAEGRPAAWAPRRRRVPRRRRPERCRRAPRARWHPSHPDSPRDGDCADVLDYLWPVRRAEASHRKPFGAGRARYRRVRSLEPAGELDRGVFRVSEEFSCTEHEEPDGSVRVRVAGELDAAEAPSASGRPSAPGGSGARRAARPLGPDVHGPVRPARDRGGRRRGPPGRLWLRDRRPGARGGAAGVHRGGRAASPARAPGASGRGALGPAGDDAVEPAVGAADRDRAFADRRPVIAANATRPRRTRTRPGRTGTRTARTPIRPDRIATRPRPTVISGRPIAIARPTPMPRTIPDVGYEHSRRARLRSDPRPRRHGRRAPACRRAARSHRGRARPRRRASATPPQPSATVAAYGRDRLADHRGALRQRRTCGPPRPGRPSTRADEPRAAAPDRPRPPAIANRPHAIANGRRVTATTRIRTVPMAPSTARDARAERLVRRHPWASSDAVHQAGDRVVGRIRRHLSPV